ncbi:hypothetical protein PILCRDRAFT_14347 [Piloderma croceum F 1598]|uniref:Uncharacterized protein n=1 Tax=Piloderma croceum (strain F 1598) TaxID=765440 RepID=A0A0C3EPT2_PILCF|nr:hypothetical protein PILCRDRAFT_14347 [Piloderma croceum F 1598]
MLSAFNSLVVQSLPDLAESMIWAINAIGREKVDKATIDTSAKMVSSTVAQPRLKYLDRSMFIVDGIQMFGIGRRMPRSSSKMLRTPTAQKVSKVDHTNSKSGSIVASAKTTRPSPTTKSQPASSASSQNETPSSLLALSNINIISSNTSSSNTYNNTPDVHTPNTTALVNQFFIPIRYRGSSMPI